MKLHKKGSEPHLLLEIVVCSILFMVTVTLLFGAHAPKQLLRLAAHVESADAALACELSLANLLRADSSQGITYSDWLMNSYIKNDMSGWKNDVGGLLNKVFLADKWELNITLPNGTRILTIEGIKNPGLGILECRAFVPFSAARMKNVCFPVISPDEQEVINGDCAVFTAGGESVKCKIYVNSDSVGVAQFVTQADASCASCNLVLTVPGGENLQPDVPNDPDMLDRVILPMKVGAKNIPYEITVREIEEGAKASVRLTRRALLRDCSLNITLGTAHV